MPQNRIISVPITAISFNQMTIFQPTNLYHHLFQVAEDAILVYKGTDPDTDSYSVFWDNNKKFHTTLNEELQKRGVTDVFVCGVAYDVCVGEWQVLATGAPRLIIYYIVTSWASYFSSMYILAGNPIWSGPDKASHIHILTVTSFTLLVLLSPGAKGKVLLSTLLYFSVSNYIMSCLRAQEVTQYNLPVSVLK